MFNWLSRLLHWRQGNDLVTKGKQIQFIPYQGVYVIARQYQGRTSMTILNGTSKPAVLSVHRYTEVIGSTQTAKDIMTGRKVDIGKDVQLRPRQTLIIEF